MHFSFQATGSRLSTLCQSLSAVVCGLIIGFVFSWKLTLLVMCFLPFILIAAIIRTRNHYRYRGPRKRDGADESTDNAGKVAANLASVPLSHVWSVTKVSAWSLWHVSDRCSFLHFRYQPKLLSTSAQWRLSRRNKCFMKSIQVSSLLSPSWYTLRISQIIFLSIHVYPVAFCPCLVVLYLNSPTAMSFFSRVWYMPLMRLLF